MLTLLTSLGSMTSRGRRQRLERVVTHLSHVRAGALQGHNASSDGNLSEDMIVLSCRVIRHCFRVLRGHLYWAARLSASAMQRILFSGPHRYSWPCGELPYSFLSRSTAMRARPWLGSERKRLVMGQRTQLGIMGLFHWVSC